MAQPPLGAQLGLQPTRAGLRQSGTAGPGRRQRVRRRAGRVTPAPRAAVPGEDGAERSEHARGHPPHRQASDRVGRVAQPPAADVALDVEELAGAGTARPAPPGSGRPRSAGHQRWQALGQTQDWGDRRSRRPGSTTVRLELMDAGPAVRSGSRPTLLGCPRSAGVHGIDISRFRPTAGNDTSPASGGRHGPPARSADRVPSRRHNRVDSTRTAVCRAWVAAFGPDPQPRLVTVRPATASARPGLVRLTRERRDDGRGRRRSARPSAACWWLAAQLTRSRFGRFRSVGGGSRGLGPVASAAAPTGACASRRFEPSGNDQCASPSRTRSCRSRDRRPR